MRIKVPYALATWQAGDEVELVAMSHWREQDAPPIRLLYPETAPPPEGTESALRVRLSPERTASIMDSLIEAINRFEQRTGWEDLRENMERTRN